MKKVFIVLLSLLAGIFSGCAAPGYYTQSDVGSVKTVNKGTVVSIRNLTVNDNGSGGLLGGIAGGAAGSQMGRGDGKVAATIGGAIMGAMLGGELNKDSGQELTIRFDNGQEIVTVYKVDKNAPFMFRNGDRVIIETLNGKVDRIGLIN